MTILKNEIKIITKNRTDKNARAMICTVYSNDENNLFFEKFQQKESREAYFRKQIENMDYGRDVMIQLYRYLVLGNFIKFDQKKGKSAQKILDAEYPNQLILLDFQIKSGFYNGLGMVIHNLQNKKDLSNDYLFLGNIIVALVNAGFQTPQIEI